MLQTFNVPIGGRQINAKGDFFRYESGNAGGGDDAIRVRADGNDLGSYLPGDSIKLPRDYSTWEITPVLATATAIVRIGLGEITSVRLSGTVRVVDEITDRIITLGIGVPTAIAAFYSTQVIDPALNTRGMVLRYAISDVTAGVGGAAYADLRLVLSKTPPTNYALPAQQLPFCVATAANGARGIKDTGLINKFVPPGFGVFYTSVVTSVAAQNLAFNLSYELL